MNSLNKLKSSVAVKLFLVAFVNFLWAAQYPAYKIASDHVSVATLNFWTFLFALLILFPFFLAERRKARPQPIFRLSATTGRQFVLLGVLGILPPSVFLAWGIEHSSAANASILSLTIPMLMTALGIVMLGERFTLLRLLSLILGLTGTLIISAPDLSHASFSKELLIGNGVIFLSGLGSAFYNASGKALLARFSELEVLFYSCFVGMASCLAIGIVAEPSSLLHPGSYPAAAWGAMLLLGALPWGLAMILWMWVLKQVEVGQISASIYLLPLFGLLLSVLTVHDRVTSTQVAGGLLIVLGTAIISIYDHVSAGKAAEGSPS